MSFKENGFEIVKQCIPIEVCKVISRSMIMAKDITLFMNNLK